MLNTYRKVLGELWEHKLYANASKCEILKISVELPSTADHADGGMTPYREKIEGHPQIRLPQKMLKE